MRIDEALTALLDGETIRRRAWQPLLRLRMDETDRVVATGGAEAVRTEWRPRLGDHVLALDAEDMIADDWEIADAR